MNLFALNTSFVSFSLVYIHSAANPRTANAQVALHRWQRHSNSALRYLQTRKSSRALFGWQSVVLDSRFSWATTEPGSLVTLRKQITISSVDDCTVEKFAIFSVTSKSIDYFAAWNCETERTDRSKHFSGSYLPINYFTTSSLTWWIK